MSKVKVEVLHDDAWDWEILVIDGRKVAEGHSITLRDIELLFAQPEFDSFAFEEVEVPDITESRHYQS